MAVWKGAALVETTTGGLLGATRFWALSTTDADPTGDQPGWDATTGTQVTVYFRTGTTGLTPPSAADSVRLEVRQSNGTVLKTLYTGATPANGTPYTFDLTDTGNPGGSERSGGLELYVQAEFDGITGDYNVDSQNTATVGSISQWARGLYVSNKKVSDLTVSAYPAGSTFAYGTAASETLTLTVTHTQPFVANQGQVRVDALDVTSTQASGSAQNVNGTTTQQLFTADNTFDDSAKSYGVEVVATSNAFLTPDSGAVKWTKLVDDGVNVEQNGDNVRRQSFYNVDPRITMGVPTTGLPIYNRGQSATVDFGVTNARGEALTRSLNWQIKDSGGSIMSSGSDTGSNYDADYTIGIADTATADFVGDQWTVNTSQSDVDSNPFQNIYTVGSLYRVVIRAQKTTILLPSGPNDTQYTISADFVYHWVEVMDAADVNAIDTGPSDVTTRFLDPDSTVIDTRSSGTEPDVTNGSLPEWTPRLRFTPEPPAGAWTVDTQVAHSGNTGSDSLTLDIASAFTENLEGIILGPVLAKPGTHRVYYRAEDDQAALVPDSLPQYRAFEVIGNVLTPISSLTDMLNSVDDTATINGPDYYVDITINTAGRYVVQVAATLAGAEIVKGREFKIANEVIDGAGFVGFPVKLDV